MSKSPLLSIVIPMLNEAEGLAALFEALFPVLEGLDQAYEVLVIDDGSTDQTLALVKAEQVRRPELKVLALARNFGQHAAILAGFQEAEGDWLITLDADLQNPPSEIPALVEQFRKGYDLVNTRRLKRQDPLHRRWASKLLNNIVRQWSGIDLSDFGCMLRGYHRDITAAILASGEIQTFLPALAMLYAKRPVEIPIAHSARQAGESKYSLFSLFALQFDLVTGFSLAPLRLLFSVGSLAALCGIGLGSLLLVQRFMYGSTWAVNGVFTLFALLFFFVGAQFFALGVLGEYIGRIHQQVRGRPPFVIRDRFESETEAARETEPARETEAKREFEGSAGAKP